MNIPNDLLVRGDHNALSNLHSDRTRRRSLSDVLPGTDSTLDLVHVLVVNLLLHCCSAAVGELVVLEN